MTAYDALNRPVLLTAPQAPGAPADVIRTTYNEANLLERIDVRLEGTAAWTAFVAAVEYDAHGRRTGIEYGNGTASTYEYDPLTFRLARTVTRRDPAAFDDCPQPPPAGWPGCQLQNLRYTYDPVGNLTRVQDDAQQAIFFRNRRVEPSATYVYDATYRLIEATGREHLGQVGGAPIPHSSTDGARTGLDWAANDGAAMGTYTERYRYDAVGNLLELAHHGTSGWSRMFSYEEASGLDALRSGNRLSTTTVGQSVETYGYDAHGNTTRMPHLGVGENAAWDHRDQLRNVNLGGGGTAYFVYDAAGERVRKVWEKAPGHVEERIYLGVFELFRKTQGGGELHRATLHVMDGEQRVALVETRTRDTAGTDTAPRQLLRFQLAGQLGSGVLELDEASRIIAYEEYTPYGSTAYQAVRSQSETPRRYRFTAKERDGETGLYHHGARYYAPWLGRWTSSDPVGLDGGLNTYLYAAANPTMLVDPGGTAPKKYEKQRPKDTAAKAREMERNLKEAKKQGLKPDPMQKRADALAKKRGKTPIEQHHHKGVKEAAKTKLDPKKMGDTMSSVWSTKSDPVVKAGIGDKPVWDPKFDGDLRTHHNVGKHLDYDEQASRPKTAKGLEDAAAASKQRLPATVDLTERAKLDWTRTVDKGPAINPKTGAVKEALEKTGKSILKKLAPKALKVIPFVGIGAGLYSTQAEAAQGNYVTAGAEAVGMIPVVGDVVDAARLGYAVGEVANEVLGIDEVAAEHGDRFEKAASSLGLGEDGARLVGATGAALSSITVAPTIAMTRKLTALFD
jgi:RHS repeat-associated protein